MQEDTTSAGSAAGAARGGGRLSAGSTSDTAAAQLHVTPVAVLPPVVRHPCLHKGYAAKYPRQHHYGVMPGHRTVELVGAPDWQACQQLVAALANASAPCPAGEHCVLGVPHPPREASPHPRVPRLW